MIEVLTGYLRNKPASFIAALCLLQVLFVGLLDFLTGVELSFSIFYLAPVLTAAWFGNRSVTTSVAAICAAVWLLLDMGAGHVYSNRLIPFWNAGVRLGFFLTAGHLAASLALKLKKEKEILDSELRIARKIQMSLVPGRFPPFPDRIQIEVHAELEPARQVGGDFYDFFFIDEDRLFFIIGDVSDKGIPAALFMAKALSLIKLSSKNWTRPDEILRPVNSELFANNDSAMFITAFCGTLDTRTGELLYANAGHNPPLLLRKGNRAELFPLSAATALGLDDTTDFQSDRMTMQPGEILFMYTDGITEALNSRREAFGEERLKAAVTSWQKPAAGPLVSHVLDEVRDFVGHAVQTDDIAMLSIGFGAQGKKGQGPIGNGAK